VVEEEPVVAPASWDAPEEEPPAAPADWEVATEEPLAESAGYEVTQPELPTLPVEREVAHEEARLGSLPTVTAGRVTPDPAAELPTVTADMSESVATAPTVTVSPEAAQEVRTQEGRTPPPRLFVWLVGICLLAFVVLVAIVIYQLVTSSSLF
jgi:hypothetical protein